MEKGGFRVLFATRPKVSPSPLGQAIVSPRINTWVLALSSLNEAMIFDLGVGRIRPGGSLAPERCPLATLLVLCPRGISCKAPLHL